MKRRPNIIVKKIDRLLDGNNQLGDGIDRLIGDLLNDSMANDPPAPMDVDQIRIFMIAGLADQLMEEIRVFTVAGLADQLLRRKP
jgi:hypothetical protein